MDEDQDRLDASLVDLREELRELRRQAELPHPDEPPRARRRRGQRSEESENYEPSEPDSRRSQGEPEPHGSVSDSRSYTEVRRTFDETASRSRDDDDRDSYDEDEPSEGEDSEDRRRRYLQSSLSEVSDPSYWQSLHHFDEEESQEMEVDRSNMAMDDEDGVPDVGATMGWRYGGRQTPRSGVGKTTWRVYGPKKQRAVDREQQLGGFHGPTCGYRTVCFWNANWGREDWRTICSACSTSAFARTQCLWGAILDGLWTWWTNTVPLPWDSDLWRSRWNSGTQSYDFCQSNRPSCFQDEKNLLEVQACSKAWTMARYWCNGRKLVQALRQLLMYSWQTPTQEQTWHLVLTRCTFWPKW